MADDDTENKDAADGATARNMLTLKRMGSMSYSHYSNYSYSNYDDFDEQEDLSWIQLRDVPFRSYFAAFRGTLLAISYKSHGYWGDAIYMYNSMDDIWDKHATYPNDFDSTNLSIALHKYTKELYGYAYNNKNNNNNTLKIIDLTTKTFTTKKIATDIDSKLLHSISTIFINDTYHLFSGQDMKTHFILNKQFELKECCKSMSLAQNYHGDRAWSVMYAVNKSLVILAGDYDTWMKMIPLYCYEMHGNPFKPNWKKVFITLPNQMEEEAIGTRALSYCYDEKSENILIFDGLRGKYIYIVNINDFQVKESKILCPENKVYDAVFVSHTIENERIVMGYAREYVGYKQLPYDILHEIANWMEGFDCVHLFDRNRGLCHWVIDVNSIVNNYD